LKNKIDFKGFVMKKVMVLLLIFGLVITATDAMAKNIQSHNAGNIIIDSKAEDWNEKPLEFFEKEKISIGVRNDNNYLYFILLSRDRDAIKTIFRTGVTFWINNKGKKDKDFGVKYLPELSEELQKIIGQDNKINEKENNSFPQRKEEMQDLNANKRGKITVIRKKLSNLISADGSSGMQAAASYSKGAYFMEIKVPLKEDENVPFAVGDPLYKEFQLGIEFGTMSDEEKEMMKGKMKEMGGGGMPSGGGGGMPPGGGGGMRPGGPGGHGMQQERIEVDMWIKVKSTITEVDNKNK